MQQAHIFISGFVQGVGFRQFVKSQAKQVGVTGWVQNTEDGKVEVVLQGDKDSIELLIEKCKKGPDVSDITDVKVNWEEEEPELHMDSFEVY